MTSFQQFVGGTGLGMVIASTALIPFTPLAIGPAIIGLLTLGTVVASNVVRR